MKFPEFNEVSRAGRVKPIGRPSAAPMRRSERGIPAHNMYSDNNPLSL
jgi:hypothetical protein